MLKILSIIGLFAVAIVAQKPPEQPAFTIHGTMRDRTGAVIGGLYINKDREKNFSVVSDINGDFKIDLRPGYHILTIDPEELYPFRAFIKITENGPNPDNLQFVIDPANVCCSSGPGYPFPKPLSLPKPAYPAAARAARARGEVIVAIGIDREGRVVSAKAQNGHPLLKAAAESAARSSRFESPAKDGNPVNQEIRLTYVFSFSTDDEKAREGIPRYMNSFRINVVAEFVVIN